MLGQRSDLLAIYLNDHLAGATAGAELARRIAGSNRDTAYGRVLARVADDIEQDRRALLDVMERLSVGADRVKLAASWAAEKVGRLKLNGKLLSYSPLSRLEELELLSIGVEGKVLLWETLRQTHAGDQRLRGVDLDELVRRGRSQRRRLDRQRRQAVEDAFREPGPERGTAGS